MAVSIAQYVDLLFKKLQGVAKTANSTIKSASNESIASPAFLRGDILWLQSNQIGNTAGAVSGIANARTNSNSVQCAPDTTVPPIGGIRPTWLSNVTYWIPQEFGSTWLPKDTVPDHFWLRSRSRTSPQNLQTVTVPKP